MNQDEISGGGGSSPDIPGTEGIIQANLVLKYLLGEVQCACFMLRAYGTGGKD